MSNWYKLLKYIAPTAPLGYLIDAIQGNISHPLTDIGNFSSFMAQKTGNAMPDNVFRGLVGKYTGANQTPADVESFEREKAWQKEYAQNHWNWDVQGMEKAGLNPQMMYGGTPSSSSPAGTSDVTAGSLSDLIALATLPLQIDSLKAQNDRTRAEADLTRQKTLTEEQITKLQSIAVEWQPALNGEQIAQMSANIDKLMSDVQVNRAQRDYVDSQRVAQEITNEYLPKRMLADIDNLSSQARNARASAAITEVQAKFAKDNGFLMSSNDALLLGTYIASLFKVEKPDIVEVVENGVKYVKEELPKDFRPWRKMSEEESMEYFLSKAKHATKD